MRQKKKESWTAIPSLYFKRLHSIDIIKVFNLKSNSNFPKLFCCQEIIGFSRSMVVVQFNIVIDCLLVLVHNVLSYLTKSYL